MLGKFRHELLILTLGCLQRNAIHEFTTFFRCVLGVAAVQELYLSDVDEEWCALRSRVPDCIDREM